MKILIFNLLACTLAAGLPGCGSTEEAAEKTPSAEEHPALAPGKREQQKNLGFETRTDTVTAVHPAERRNVGGKDRETRIRFMVQIGAFKDPHLASARQTEARKRFHMPVLNDYHAGTALYQIRIGFFESRENARNFLHQIQGEHPADYRDSWVVQLKR